ncbi:hypothetical protein [Knoellia sp. CPCC 206435]|uniref:hypothetical protein n=1 Tax=Knoellia terrae TaxID=3404797 RepID=UPI003B433503
MLLEPQSHRIRQKRMENVPIRLRLLGASSLLLLCTATVGCSGSDMTGGSAASAKPTGAVLSCPGGNVNSGTVDSSTEGEPITDISDHATKWATATGFADRFPSARVSVQEGENWALAKFDDDAGVRAELTYQRAAGGWTIDTLQYC